MNKEEEISSYLQRLLPDAKCALHFDNPFQCVIAVSLSAQTSDESVNRVTPALFLAYPTPQELASASIEDVEKHIQSLGLYHNKARHLIAMAQGVVTRFGGEIPTTREELVSLPGVGVKTANVVGAECFHTPAIAVDTHVSRVAKRLGLASATDEPLQIERKLERKFPKEEWIPLHHRFIWFGRLICHAQKPECEKCGLTSFCRYFKKASIKAGK